MAAWGPPAETATPAAQPTKSLPPTTSLIASAYRVEFNPSDPVERETGYNPSMTFAIFGIRVLEVMFFVGMAGSAVVVLISFVEDFKELFGKE